MRNVVVLFIIGLLSFSCKSETPKGEKCEAEVSIYKVYNAPELMEKVTAVVSQNDSVGLTLFTELCKSYGMIATKDTAIVKDYIAKLNFDNPTALAFLPLNTPDGEELVSVIVYEQTPLISETVTLAIVPNEYNSYEAPFKFADAEKWEQVTKENVGRQLALAVNGVIKSAPIVNEPITGGHCSVIGPDLDKLLK
ncbi:MAG: hypothetical protein IJE73_02095 [Muribaculaceae bacterium]|nr:hypothetical protein [Muribaculaceae bacterium]